MWTTAYFTPQKAKSDLGGLEKSEKEFSQKALEREIIYQWCCNLWNGVFLSVSWNKSCNAKVHACMVSDGSFKDKQDKLTWNDTYVMWYNS